MWIRSHLLKKSLMENFFFCAVEIAADLSIIPEKVMEESKEINRNWTGPKTFLSTSAQFLAAMINVLFLGGSSASAQF